MILYDAINEYYVLILRSHKVIPREKIFPVQNAGQTVDLMSTYYARNNLPENYQTQSDGFLF